MKEDFKQYKNGLFADCEVGNIECVNCRHPKLIYINNPLYKCNCGGVIHEQHWNDGIPCFNNDCIYDHWFLSEYCDECGEDWEVGDK